LIVIRFGSVGYFFCGLLNLFRERGDLELAPLAPFLGNPQWDPIPMKGFSVK